MPPGLAVLLVVAVGPVTQADRAPLRLEIEGCADIDPTVVSRVLTVELGATLEDASSGIATAHVQCREPEVQVTIDDPITGKRTTRVLNLEGQPRGMRSRLLGLAISEAVLASWIELQITPAPAVVPSAAVAPPEMRRQAANIAGRRVQVVTRTSSVERFELSAGPAAQWFGSGLVALGFSAAAIRWLRAYPFVGVALDLDGGYGEQSKANLGRASATDLSLAPRLLMRAGFGRLSVAAGAGWGAGLARLSAEPADSLRAGHTALAAWTGPFLALDLDIRLWRSMFLRAGVEGGRVLAPAAGTIGGVRAIALDGAWIRGAFSLGVKL